MNTPNPAAETLPNVQEPNPYRFTVSLECYEFISKPQEWMVYLEDQDGRWPASVASPPRKKQTLTLLSSLLHCIRR